MYFIGQVSATVVLSALWPLCILNLIAFLSFALFAFSAVVITQTAMERDVCTLCICVSVTCAVHILIKKPQKHKIEYMNIIYNFFFFRIRIVYWDVAATALGARY